MPLEIVPLKEKHLEDAAVLASARYRALRDHVPLLPPRYEERNTILPMLRDLAGQGPGVAAIQRGRLVGFLHAWLIPDFRGKRSVFSPEWANAADLEDSRRIYEEMYAHISARWVADGFFTHLISLLADDGEAMDGWHWLGFGLLAADGVRDLGPAPGPTAKVDIRRGQPEDLEEVATLLAALQRHHAAAPTFLYPAKQDSLKDHKEWLGNPANAIWLAYQATGAVACMGQGPANPDACTIIRDPGTTSIVSAFTQESARGQGIATALLNRVLAWARTEGYERCAVDWEPMNSLANRFWTRHFQPVTYALVRHIDERIAGA